MMEHIATYISALYVVRTHAANALAALREGNVEAASELLEYLDCEGFLDWPDIATQDKGDRK